MSEYTEHVTVCNWLKTFYPDIIFFSSGDGLRLHPKTALDFSKLKSCRGIPDIFITEPNEKFNGLFIEMKNLGINVLKKDGISFTTETIEQQNITMERLEQKGYFCCFAIGANAAINIIEKYLYNRL